VALAESAVEMPVLEGMIEMVVRVILAGVMADPFVAFGMDVRSCGVAFRITVRRGSIRRWSRPCRWSGTGVRRRAARGNVSPADAANLCRRGNCKQQERKEKSETIFHFKLLEVVLESIWSCEQKRPSSGRHYLR
jgi:hypothetical protein